MEHRLAIILTHPVQYYAPVFQLLAKYAVVKVFYTWGEAGYQQKVDPGFGKVINWDIPLLDGYEYEFLINTSKNPGSHHFYGIKNPNIIEKIEEYRPDAILVYGWSYESHLKTMRYFKGKIPVWFRGDSTLLNSRKGLKSIFKNIFLKWVYKHVDKAFYVGSYNKEYFLKYGLSDQQLFFSPHAIDNDRFSEDRRKEANLLRESFGVNTEDILILFAGKFEPNKDPQLLLHAFIDILNTNAPKLKSHLLFVGNGILEDSLKTQILNLNLKHSIHFLDFQNQLYIPTVYQACDLFCLPSQSETWGLAVNEAMAAGKAVVVSKKVGCSSDLVKPGENGDIFASGDLTSLKKCLTENLHKEKLLQFGNRSLEIISDWTFESQMDVILNQFNLPANIKRL